MRRTDGWELVDALAAPDEANDQPKGKREDPNRDQRC
jgi:hypothetical protein